MNSVKDFEWPFRLKRWLRVQKLPTKLLGPKHARSRESIEIDITYHCNLKCINCNRSIRQAPSQDQMTIEQIEKFINESIENKITWKRIRVLGGEPTLHPNIHEILDLLLKYKHSHSPKTCIQIFTNGFGDKINRVLSKISKEIIIENSSKNSGGQLFLPFNISPKDSILYKFADYSNGCWVSFFCGIGLTPYGYYPCAVAGSIDRVYGFDIGKKKMPALNDSMFEQLQIFCKLCGLFKYAKDTKKTIISNSWEKAYKNYKTKKPKLSLY